MKNALKALVVVVLLVFVGITSVGSVRAAGLTDDEVYWLTYMRGEEKPARDVYLFFYDKWGSPIFSKIAASEQTHMNAVKTLLDRFGIADPVNGQSRGELTNQDLQALYGDLIKRGAMLMGGDIDSPPQNEEEIKAFMALFDVDRVIRTAVTGLKVLIEKDLNHSLP